MRILLVSALLAIAAVAGCHSGSKPQSQESAASSVKVYHLRGKVVSTDPAHGIVVVAHEAIPGFMDAMTMPFQLKDPGVASKLHPGDTITADVLVSKRSEETVMLDHIVVIAQAKPGYKPMVFHHAPAPGDAVPDFRLRAYGAQYIGSDVKNAFAHWDFAAPSKPGLLEMTKYFDVGITRDANDTITHTL